MNFTTFLRFAKECIPTDSLRVTDGNITYSMNVCEVYRDTENITLVCNHIDSRDEDENVGFQIYLHKDILLDYHDVWISSSSRSFTFTREYLIERYLSIFFEDSTLNIKEPCGDL
jgi:hypothetical protein